MSNDRLGEGVWSAPTTVRTARLRAQRRAALSAGGASMALACVVVTVTGEQASSEPTRPGAGPIVSARIEPAAVDNGGLRSAVAGSVRKAIAAADKDGVALRVTSGWRSADEQAALYATAIRTYGSAGAARRWVLPAGESEHVRGGAVDVGPPAGARWLRRNGVRFGLCQRYGNEPWHFERLAGAKGSRCPAIEPHP